MESPLDARVEEAIRSLDGQLENFRVDEIGVVVHASIVRALLHVNSLRVLRLDTISPGLTIADLRKLRELGRLEEIQFPLAHNFGYFNEEEYQEAEEILREVQAAAKLRAAK